MIFFAPWSQTSAWINHPRNIAVVLITVLTLSATLLLSAGDSAAQTSTSWSYCASEGGQCNFSGTREVRYGANGNYAYGIFTNGVSCNNGVFGDPLSGIVKECQFGDGASQSSSSTQNNTSPTTPTNDSSWSYCASEGGQCNFSGTGKSVTAPTVIIPMAYSPTAPTVTTACLAIPYLATLRRARLKMARRNPRQPRPTRSAQRQPIRERVIMSAKTAAIRIAAHRRGVHPLPS